MKKRMLSAAVTVALLSVVSSAQAYYTNGGTLYSTDGKTVAIDGVNWAGFQNPGEGLAGLWGQIDLNTMTNLITQPWSVSGSGVTTATGVTLGTIRLPISPQTLRRNWNDPTAFSTPDANHIADKISTVFGNAGISESQFNSTYGSYDSSDVRIGNDRPDLNPQFKAIDGGHMTQLHELIAFIQQMKQNNVRVLIDFHQNVNGRDQNTTEGVYTLSQYYNDVAFIAKYVKLLGLTNVIGIDVFNEPNNMNWFGTSPAAPQGAGMAQNWSQMIATAAQAVYNNNPDLLLFVEGPNSNDPATVKPICIANYPQDSVGIAYSQTSDPTCPGQSSLAFKSNWGENFQPLLNAAAAKQGKAQADLTPLIAALTQAGLTSAQLTWLLGTSNSGANAHIVFSPHTYGAHVGTWQPQSEAALELSANWNYGFLAKAGYAVAIGESGYDSGSDTDKTFFTQELTPYLIKNNLNHNLFFWEFPSDSGDTGGLMGNGDSLPMETTKEQALKTLFGGTPAPMGSIAASFANIPATLQQKPITDAVAVDGGATTNCNISATGCSILNITVGSHAVTAAVIKDMVSPSEEDDYTFGAVNATVSANQAAPAVFDFNSASKTVMYTHNTSVNYTLKNVPAQAQALTATFASTQGDSSTCTINAGQTSAVCSITNHEASTAGTETFSITAPTISGYTLDASNTTASMSFASNGTATPASAQASYTAIAPPVTYSVPVTVAVNNTYLSGQTATLVFSNGSNTFTDVVNTDNQAHAFSLPAGTYSVKANDFNAGSDHYAATLVVPQNLTLPASGAAVSVNYGKVQPASGNCVVKVQLNNSWPVYPNSFGNTLNLYVQDTGTVAINAPWTLVVKGSGYTSAQSWNWSGAVTNSGVISGQATQTWENLLPNKQNTINVGANVFGTNTNFAPTSITLNGQACTIQ